MNADGMNTAHSTRAIATSAAPTSSMLRTAASCGERPAAMLRSTFSTTTIASSTTMPIASTIPNSERLLIENPTMAITKNVPTSEIGMAMIGMIAARQVCRNNRSTNTTNIIAFQIVSITALTDSG